MPAYLIADISRIEDESEYALYRSAVSPVLEGAGGAYLARGGATEVFEGDWRPGRLVLVRFPSIDAARAWWSSPAYAPLRRQRQGAARANMIVVEGLAVSAQ
jgi:uncharacterized protein (DUF1330 family)